MRILVAPDKFKGSVAAAEVAELIAAGLAEALPAAEIVTLAIADGGEGTANVICSAAGGEWRSCVAHDALGSAIDARYCTIDGGRTAVMEISEAAGLWRVAEQLRNPETASSFGVGEMLLDAARGGAANLIIGLGGSATNDGGFGMARALGFRFVNAAGVELNGGVSELRQLQSIERPAQLKLPAITAAVDVDTPLLGMLGATQIFGGQKGATEQQKETLELALTRLADVVARDFGFNPRDLSGSGAAGGLGFGLVAFCGAAIRSGFEVVAECIGLEQAIRDADVVITGEGRLDTQTLHGKAPAGVARLARKHAKRCCAIVGEFRDEPSVSALFDEVVIAKPVSMSRDEAMRNAPVLLRECGRRFGASLAR